MFASEIHADVRRIADCLSATPIGSTITWPDMSSVIGRDLRRCRHVLYSAERIAQRESGAVFLCERGKGYRRLPVEEIASVGATARSRIRRQARRGNTTIAAGIDGANDIPAGVLRTLLREQSMLGLIAHMARDRSLPTIPIGDTRPLPVAVVARQFLDLIGG